MNCLHFIIEPVGSVRPKIVSADKLNVVESATSENATLLCPAQSYPVPSFRYYFKIFTVSQFNLFTKIFLYHLYQWFIMNSVPTFGNHLVVSFVLFQDI